MTSSPDVLREALRLQRIGISVIPLGSNKRPGIEAWKQYQTRPADEQQVHDWFDGRDDLGLAIVLGGVSSNLIARDFDDQRAYASWESSYPSLAHSLPTVATSRGRHVYCRQPDVSTIKFGDGELRGARSYVVAPPSRHPSGCRYEWLVPLTSLDEVPMLTPEQSGFDRDWLASDGGQSLVTDRTESTSVRSARSVLSVTEETMIEGTLPHAYGQRRQRLFELARRIRVDPQLRDVPIRELRPLVEHWHQLALPYIRTKVIDETWADFVEAFNNIELARCGDAAVIAMTAANEKELPPEALRYLCPINRRLVALCAELGRRSVDGVFFLACRKATTVIGVSNHMVVARSLQMLVADGVLTEVVKGGPHTNKATRYQWKGRA